MRQTLGGHHAELGLETSRHPRQQIAAHLPLINGLPARIGIGTAYLGGPGDSVRLGEIQQTLDAAYAAGFRIFDTSPRYGEAEARLGRWLRGVRRESLLLWSKAPIPEHLTPREARRYVRDCLHASLEKLGTQRLDAWFFHDIERLDQVFAPDGAAEAAHEAVAEGLVAHVGVATRPHALLQAAARHPLIGAVLTHSDYNLTDVSAAELISEVHGLGKAVVNASPLGWGLLSSPDFPERLRERPEMYQRMRAAGHAWRVAEEFGVSTLALALQFPCRNARIDVTLTGPATPLELRSTVKALAAHVPEEAWLRLERDLFAANGSSES